MEPVALSIDGELRVVTENSVWLIRPDTYCRMPRREEARDAPGPELTDGAWHPHVGAWMLTTSLGAYLRLLPPDRPEGATGIVTSTIVDPVSLLANPAGRSKRRVQGTVFSV